MEISRMLTVSTAHITSETADFIDNACKDCINSPLIVYKKTAKINTENGDSYTDDYGWFIYCNIYKTSNIPNDLLKLMRFTNDSGCEWLCLDRDGEVLDNEHLDVYEW